MISANTSARIWECHREIKVAENLLEEIKTLNEGDWFNQNEGKLKDAFGRRKDFQLGIPSGDASHRLFNVSPKLALSVIRAHIEHKRAELAEANEQARLELDSEIVSEVCT